MVPPPLRESDDGDEFADDAVVEVPADGVPDGEDPPVKEDLTLQAPASKRTTTHEDLRMATTLCDRRLAEQRACRVDLLVGDR
jgi:hypothetical protein